MGSDEPSGRNRRGPYAPTRARRDAVGSVALEIVDELGHEAVTTALVAERSGIAKPAVHYHFPTRDHLLVAALERIDLSVDIDTINNIDEQPVESINFETIIPRTGEHVFSSEKRLRLYVSVHGQSATPGHPAAEYFTRRTRLQLALFTKIVAALQVSGRAHPGLDPRTTAQQVIAHWDGLVFLGIHDPGFDLEAVLLDGIRRIVGRNWVDTLAALTATDAGL
ncbi:TetR/AcrR family transcriptional regulator [Nocardia macrotermitis]|uniref:TetR/AcrR family transcriptional regulator n=1 Tax=Nocardia macrotermitis TaxID=2585198 RepID=UPI0018861770|nr:TetR/AcrR family transcriptional regulator [Nocardia macrotermitis]